MINSVLPLRLPPENIESQYNPSTKTIAPRKQWSTLLCHKWARAAGLAICGPSFCATPTQYLFLFRQTNDWQPKNSLCNSRTEHSLNQQSIAMRFNGLVARSSTQQQTCQKAQAECACCNGSYHGERT